MKTLTRFWQWHDTEKPEALRALKLGNELLSLAARLSIDLAATLIDCREDESQSLGCRNCTRDILERFPVALRDLSLSLCPALEAMHAAVPRGEPALAPWVEIQEPFVTAWYRPQPTGAGRIMRINDQLLAHDQAERDSARSRYADMFEGKLPWVSLTGCPGCGCVDDSSHMGACPLLGASEGKWVRAKAIQAEQRELAHLDEQPGWPALPPPVKVI